MKSALRYFCWLSFANTILIAGQMLRVRTPVFDYLAAWGLLGVYLTLALLLLSLVMAAASRICRPLIDALVFAVVAASGADFLRMMFMSHGIHPLWLPTRLLLLCTSVAATLLFLRFRRAVAPRLPEITRNMGIVSTAALVFWFVSLVAFELRSSHQAVKSGDAPAHAPNIIYIVLDAMTARDMSVYGYRLQTTPHLEELARHWTVYEDANSAGTGTVANMPAVLTGRYPVLKPWSLYGELPGRVKGWLNLADILHAHGYRTLFLNGGGMNANFFHFQKSFDEVITAGTGWYLTHDPLTWSARLPPAVWNVLVGKNIPLDAILPYPYALHKTGLVEPLYAYIEGMLRRKEFLQNNRPFFLYMHMLRPHAPYLANEYAGAFLPLSEGFQTFSSQLRFLSFPQVYPPAEQPVVDQLRLRYDENILKADAEVGRLIATLKEENLYDQSLIIVTADHGTSFSNGYVGYYSPVVSAPEHSIPLLVKFPHQTQGRRVRGLVSTVDIAPTILTMLKIGYSTGDVDGAPLQTAGRNRERVIYVCNASDPSHSFAALYQDMKIVQSKMGRALFDLKRDPQERVNLWGRLPAPVLEKALEHFLRKIAAMRQAAQL